MNCSECRWSNPGKLEFMVFEEDGLKGIIPKRGTSKSSGIDVFIPEGFKETFLKPNDDILIRLNLKARIPSNFDLTVNNKSGVATNKKLIKGAELIDEDYRGNIMIHLFNNGNERIILQEKMKIAQLVLRPIYRADFEMVDFIGIDTERGEGALGSTGDK